MYITFFIYLIANILLAIWSSFYLSIHPSIYLSIYPSAFLSIYHVFFYLLCLPNKCLSIYLSIYLIYISPPKALERVTSTAPKLLVLPKFMPKTFQKTSKRAAWYENTTATHFFPSVFECSFKLLCPSVYCAM